MFVEIRKLIAGCAVATAMALPVSAQAATIVIDDFTSGFFTLSDSTGGGASTATQFGTMLGGSRAVAVQQVAGTGTQTTARVEGASQFFDYASGITASGNATVTYNNNGAGLTPPLDVAGLTNGNFIIDFLLIDIGLSTNPDFEVTILLTDENGQTSSVSRFFGDTLVETAVLFPFADFITANGLLDLSALTQIQFRVAGARAADAAISSFLVQTGVIPLPGALPLFLTAFGLMGVVSYRRSRRA